MRKVYNTPCLRFIELENESCILEGSVAFCSEEEEAKDMESALTNKQNLWDRGGIWK